MQAAYTAASLEDVEGKVLEYLIRQPFHLLPALLEALEFQLSHGQVQLHQQTADMFLPVPWQCQHAVAFGRCCCQAALALDADQGAACIPWQFDEVSRAGLPVHAPRGSCGGICVCSALAEELYRPPGCDVAGVETSSSTSHQIFCGRPFIAPCGSQCRGRGHQWHAAIEVRRRATQICSQKGQMLKDIVASACSPTARLGVLPGLTSLAASCDFSAVDRSWSCN